ncbi:MAG: hypothetical protein ACYS1A_08185 [Planctomycetota bacterium]|jgi:hypothetical protein
MNWHDKFDARELSEIEFCRIYVNKFNHGTDGHLVKTIVAKLALLMDDVEITTDKANKEA